MSRNLNGGTYPVELTQQELKLVKEWADREKMSLSAFISLRTHEYLNSEGPLILKYFSTIEEQTGVEIVSK